MRIALLDVSAIRRQRLPRIGIIGPGIGVSGVRIIRIGVIAQRVKRNTERNAKAHSAAVTVTMTVTTAVTVTTTMTVAAAAA